MADDPPTEPTTRPFEAGHPPRGSEENLPASIRERDTSRDGTDRPGRHREAR